MLQTKLSFIKGSRANKYQKVWLFASVYISIYTIKVKINI